MVSVTIPLETETMLMLLDTWLTTHTSSLFLGFSETGSRPTGISAINTGFAGWVTSNTDNVAFGVLTANKRVPSGERRMGLVCAPSKFAKAPDGTCPKAAGASDADTKMAIAIVPIVGRILSPVCRGTSHPTAISEVSGLIL